MASRWALVCDRAHGTRPRRSSNVSPGLQREGMHMFGQERSYFRYVVVALIGLMSLAFFVLGGKG